MTDRYAVIGQPVAHSLSPRIHTLFAEQLGQVVAYEKIAAPLDRFVEAVKRFFDEGGAGLNVTLPFKEQAFAWVTEHDQYAGAAGAVNTISRQARVFRGSNTDGMGLVRDLVHCGVRLLGARVLVLGAGGAVRGVLGPLLGESPDGIVIANRTRSRARLLVERFEDPRLTECALDSLRPPFNVVVNGTSAGLGGELPRVAHSVVRGSFCYDMVYGAAAEPYLKWALLAGAVGCADGLGMLIEQAAEAFWLWRRVRPETRGVLEAMRRELEGRT